MTEYQKSDLLPEPEAEHWAQRVLRRGAAFSFICMLLLILALQPSRLWAMVVIPHASPPASQLAATSVDMSVTDFLIDKDTFHPGTQVTVKGTGDCGAVDTDVTCFINGEQASQIIILDISRLARDDRKRLLACGIGMSTCHAAISFTIPSGLIFKYPADRIQWQ